VPSILYLILSEVEGRTAPMQGVTMCADASSLRFDKLSGREVVMR
jgi:hypothetical protein